METVGDVGCAPGPGLLVPPFLPPPLKRPLLEREICQQRCIQARNVTCVGEGEYKEKDIASRNLTKLQSKCAQT